MMLLVDLGLSWLLCARWHKLFFNDVVDAHERNSGIFDTTSTATRFTYFFVIARMHLLSGWAASLAAVVSGGSAEA